MKNLKEINLDVQNINHNFGTNQIIKNFSFSVLSGEVICLLGPSGSGKSTILRLIAGLEKLQRGKILLNNHLLSEDRNELVPPEKRKIGFVFQDLALFPHLNVKDNIMYGMNYKSKHEKIENCDKLLIKIGIENLKNKYPHELSGGEQQRVALARALAPNPILMLLDEPFSDLDTRLRDKVRDETISILKSNGTSILLVTHDPFEAMLVADKIIIIDKPHLIQQSTPRDLYFNPSNKFVANFFGDINIFNGQVDGDNILFLLGIFNKKNDFVNKNVEVIVRNEAIIIHKNSDKAKYHIEGKIFSVKNVGVFQYIELTVENHSEKITARLNNNSQFEIGSTVWIGFDPEFTYVFKIEDD